MAKPKRTNRRGFLKGAAAGTAALAAQSTNAAAQQAAGANQVAAAPARVEVGTPDKFGAGFTVDVLKSLGFEYAASNSASSVRGLHESLINYGGNKNPEWLTCLHEETSIAMARGYAKIDGKPMRHGRTAQGVGGARKLAPKPIPLAAGIAYVRKPTGNMIAYSPKILSDAELADIGAPLRTIPDNPSPDSIPILNP